MRRNLQRISKRLKVTRTQNGPFGSAMADRLPDGGPRLAPIALSNDALVILA